MQATSGLVQGLMACRRRGSSALSGLAQGVLSRLGQTLPALGQTASVSGVTAPSPMQLGQIVKLEELLKKSPQEVADIWISYHEDPKGGRAASVISASEYHKFTHRAKESPMFVLPLAKGPSPSAPTVTTPGGGSYVTLLVQCQLPVVLVTGLEEFKRYGPNAPPHLSLTHYTELLDSHGLALVRGDIIHDKGLNQQEARSVMELIRAFYTSEEDYPLVRTFNHAPAAFDFEALLRKLGLTSG